VRSDPGDKKKKTGRRKSVLRKEKKKKEIDLLPLERGANAPSVVERKNRRPRAEEEDPPKTLRR